MKKLNRMTRWDSCWVVYFKDIQGYREGQEVIYASTREEAIKQYRNFFNVSGKVYAIKRFEAGAK